MADYTSEINEFKKLIYNGKEVEVAALRNFLLNYVGTLSPLHTADEKLSTLADVVNRLMHEKEPEKYSGQLTPDVVARAILADIVGQEYEAEMENYAGFLNEQDFSGLIYQFRKYKKGEINIEEMLRFINNNLQILSTRIGKEQLNYYIKRYIRNGVMDVKTLHNPAEKRQMILAEYIGAKSEVDKARQEYEAAQRKYEEQLSNLEEIKQKFNKDRFSTLDQALAVTVSNQGYSLSNIIELTIGLMGNNPDFDKISRRRPDDPEKVSYRETLRQEAIFEPIGLKVMHHVLLLKQLINNYEAQGLQLPVKIRTFRSEIESYAAEFSKYNRDDALNYLNTLNERDKQALALLFAQTRYAKDQSGLVIVSPELQNVPLIGEPVEDNLDYSPRLANPNYTL